MGSMVNQTITHGGLGYKRLKGPMLCVSPGGFSRGVFFSESPLKESYNVFALQIILLSLAYQLVRFILRPLKQTKFVCSVLAGILIGPHMLGTFDWFRDMGLFPKRELLITSTIGSLGIAYFIFLVAVKMDVTMLRRTAKKATIIGSLSVLIPFAAISVATYLLPIAGMRSGFFRFLFASGVSVTRFANVADAFDELDMLTSQQSQLVLSSSMLSEVFTWISLVTGIIYRNKDNKLISIWLLLTVVGVFSAAAALRSFAKKIINDLNDKGEVKVNEMLITSILVVALVMAFITDLIGSLHLGILVMGLVMPDGPPLGSAIIERAEYMVKELFMPVFYVLVGISTDIGSINSKMVWEIFVFVIVGFTTKFLAAVAGAVACRKDLRDAVLIGLMVNVKGPMDLYLFLRWQERKEVAKHTHAVLVLSHVVLTAVVTPLIQHLYGQCQRFQRSDRKGIRAIQTSSNYDEFKIMCCVHSMDNIPAFLSILEASNGPRSSRVAAVILHLNDLAGRAAPFVVRNDKPERKVETNKSDAVAHEFECYTRRSDRPIALTNYTVVAPYRTMHENIGHLAQKERTTLIILPYRKIQGDAGASEAIVAQATAMRNLNCQMVGCNPCGLGILVNRGLGRCMGHDSFSCTVHVAVIFTGGNDDREALAFGIRMLTHPSVLVTMLRLVVRRPREYMEDMLERKLDEALVEEFRIIGMEDARARLHQEVVVDAMSTMNAIRAFGDHYHLVMTGRYSSQIVSVFDELLDTQESWAENPELGIIGDFISSDDYNKGKSSALIMQRYPSKISNPSKRRAGDFDDEYLLGRLI